MPQAGIHLGADRNRFISLTGGYFIVPAALDSLTGWRTNVGATITFW